MAAVLFWAYHNGRHVARIDYHAATQAKQERLASLVSPKVIVIGGSNMTFGIDSELLEQVLCRPVVNMSIHAGLGVQFMVNEVKSHLGPRDVVIAGFELSSYNTSIMDNEVHVMMVDLVPDAMQLLPWYRRPRIYLALAIMRCQAAWKYATGEWDGVVADRVYRASGFNERGDMVAHLDLPQRGAAQQQPVVHQSTFFGHDMLPLMQELADSASAHGARVVITWPAIAASSRRPDIEKVISERMAEAGFPLLGDPISYVFPDTAFHDTHYHPRAYARQLRTRRLISDLCSSGRVECCTE